MRTRTAMALAASALVVAGAAVWVSLRGGPERAAADRPVLASLADSLDAVSEVRLSRGDGTATTLQRRDSGWFVAQRDYPADPARLRSLLSELAELRTVEQKTSDPARYAALNVEDPAGSQSRSVRIDVVAGAHNWALLVGKASQPNGCFVRVPGAPAALLAQPRIDIDPQPARWIRTELVDVPADRIQQITVQPAGSPSYSLTRDARGAADLTLHGIPQGRKAGPPAVVDAVASTLTRLNVQDVKARAAGALDHPSRASFRTFDGLQIDLDGYREGGSAWIRVSASVDQAAARRHAAEVAAAADGANSAKATPGEAKAAETQGAANKEAQTKGAGASGAQGGAAADPPAEAAAINARLQAFDFQVPVYQYDQLYRQLKDLLAPGPEKAAPTASKPPG